MKIIDNLNSLLGDDFKNEIKPGSKVRIAASTFSIFAFEALREELEQVGELDFIFTSPSFVTEKATDKVRKEGREFFIPAAWNTVKFACLAALQILLELRRGTGLLLRRSPARSRRA